MFPYQKTIEEIVAEYKTDPQNGLSLNEAEKRLGKNGLNILPTKKKPPLIYKFFDQFKDVLIIILLVATLISFFLGEMIDALVIALIVIINALIGFVQEVKAEKTLNSLKSKDTHFALVVRSGNIEKILFSEVVTGDIIILEEGSQIPADGRLIESFSLRVDESILTGESNPTSKNPKEISAKELPLADRINMVFKDTKVLAGRGKALVTQTGKETEMGKIAVSLEDTPDSKTPLTLQLEKVSQGLTVVISIIAVFVFVINFVKDVPLIESLLVSISLAVAAIPEGLPAIVAIVLSLGIKRLAIKNTIVKKLPSVETLGAVNLIASDKTGTLTQNKISVTQIILPDNTQFTIEGVGYEPQGTFFNQKGKIINPLDNRQLEKLLKIGILGSNAIVNDNEVIGDTTEAALVIAAIRSNINPEEVRASEQRIFEIPFSSERKMMSVAVKVDDTNDHYLYVKGAPEVILDLCRISSSKKAEQLSLAREMAKDGLRSLSVAIRKLSTTQVKKLLEEETVSETELELVGMFGMEDPLRPEVTNAISKAKKAGIKTIMITGDHKETAIAIAKKAGILSRDSLVLTETDVEKLSKKELASRIKSGVAIFARISPLGKLKIVEAIKQMPNTLVAVTGDGVNDAPALKTAHIGLAMGQTGTDLTREVADIVITDDNYATIIDAVKEGRVIYANLVKFIRYLISCNLSEVIVVTAGIFFNLPMPLLPIQILWINLITDGFPALALGVDPPEYDVMKKPPRDLSKGILHKKRWKFMLLEGTVMGTSVFLLFVFSFFQFSYSHAQTMAFTALGFSQLVHAFNNRSTRKSVFKLGFFSNKYLVIAVVVSVMVQIIIVQSAIGNLIFNTNPLTFPEWVLIASVSLIPLLITEIKKLAI